jgi:hypothetical protein
MFLTVEQAKAAKKCFGFRQLCDAYLSGIVSNRSLSPRNDLNPRSNVVIS